MSRAQRKEFRVQMSNVVVSKKPRSALPGTVTLTMGSVLQRTSSLVLIRIILDWVYVAYTVPNHAWQYHFAYHSSFDMYIGSWVMLALTIPLVLLYESSRLSSLVIVSLYAVSFVPTTTIIAYQGVDTGFAVTFLVYWIVFLVAGIAVPQHIGSVRGERTPRSHVLGKWHIAILSAVLFVVSVFINYRYTGFSVTLDLSSAYDLRERAAEANMPGILQLLFHMAKTCIPILIIYYLSVRKRAVAVLLCLAQVLLFSMDGGKSSLFSLVIALVLFFVFKKISIELILWCIAGFLLVSVLELQFIGTDNLLNYGTRRLFFVPSILNYDYFTFFSVNPIDFYRQSLFSKVGWGSYYPMPISNVIGLNCLGDSSIYANNGLYADAFANLGYAGMLIMPIVVVAFLRFIDYCSRGLGVALASPLFVGAAFTLFSSSFFTVLITHGLLFNCVVAYLLPRDSDIK